MFAVITHDDDVGVRYTTLLFEALSHNNGKTLNTHVEDTEKTAV